MPSTVRTLRSYEVVVPDAPFVPAQRAVPDRALPLQEARRLMTFVLEAVDGRRPPAQLAGVVTDDVVRSMQVTAGVRTRLGGLHLCRAAPEAFELAGTLIQGSRVRALAARVEYHDGAWQCTVFRVLSG